MLGSQAKATLITTQDQVNLDRAEVSLKFSEIEFDEQKQEFWAGVDKVQFESVYSIISKILQAHGYVVNLENILAAMDSLKICVKASGSRKPEDGPLYAKNMTYGIHFKMPNKNSKGQLLDFFYQEIRAYESELARLQKFETSEENDENKNENQLREENRKLRQMNDRLAAKVDELTHMLIQSRREQAESSQALFEADKLPKDIRIGKVRNISISDRTITVATDKLSHNISMLDVNLIPEPNDPVLLYIMDGRVINAYFYASNIQNTEYQIGTVLHAEGHTIKVRTGQRNELLIKARNEDEKNHLRQIRRGSFILLTMYKGQLIKYALIKNQDENRFSDFVNEAIVKNQIVDIKYEIFIGDSKKTTEEEAA